MDSQDTSQKMVAYCDVITIVVWYFVKITMQYNAAMKVLRSCYVEYTKYNHAYDIFPKNLAKIRIFVWAND